MKGKSLWFWTLITIGVFILIVVLYKETNLFKAIWGGIKKAYYWLKNLGK